jgi:hypothetical protein
MYAIIAAVEQNADTQIKAVNGSLWQCGRASRNKYRKECLMLNSALELHDSSIGEIRQQGSDVIVLFSHTYIHKSTGRPAWDAGSG